MSKTIRTGAVGALLDEYHRAILELNQLIESLPPPLLLQRINPDNPADEFQTIQDILSHVVHSGFGYATSIHNLKNPGLQRPEKTFHDSFTGYAADLEAVFEFTENVFADITDKDLEVFEESLKIKVAWGQVYDIEQLMEHAIVHILRHRRQIERLLPNPEGC